jgi:hypothetical protein
VSTVEQKVAHVRRATQTRSHRCHAEGCEVQVPPAIFMCKRHWFMVPKAIRYEIWGLYRVGQERDLSPSREYLDAAERAIAAVAKAEGSAPQRTLPL